MKNRSGHQSIRRDAPLASAPNQPSLTAQRTLAAPAHGVSRVVRSSGFHYAHMRAAEQTARRLSVSHSAHTVLGGLTGITWDQLNEAAAARDSYYLLAAAHRTAGQRRERAERRAADRKLFRQDPARFLRLLARSAGSNAGAAVRSIRRAVNV